jgi:2-dehydropantoate 2-reductase
MKTAIYGAGAMGTVLGAFMTQAGYSVTLINHNKEHIKALQKNGAQIIGTTQLTIEVEAILPKDMEDEYDVILLMTKQSNNTEIVTFLKSHLSENGIICTMQNGLPEHTISKVIGPDKTYGATMSWGASFIAPGVIELTTVPSKETLTFALGAFGKPNQAILNTLKEIFETMGHVTIEDNLLGARWAKLMINSAFSGLSVVTGETFGSIIDNHVSRQLALDIVNECINVADASNIKIEAIQGKHIKQLLSYKTIFKKWFALFVIKRAMKKHRNIKSSMLRDLERGRKTEVHAINGVIVDYALECGVKVPLNERIIEIVSDIELGLKEPSKENLMYMKRTS